MATIGSVAVGTHGMAALKQAGSGIYTDYVALFARRPFFFRFLLAAAFRGRLFGVFELTRFDGRQYSPLSHALPQGRPVRVLTHFSRPQRLRFDPALPFRTFPWLFLHFAIAWDARADGNVLYCALTFR